MNFLSVLYAKAGIIVDGVTTLNNTATALTPATNDNSTNIATTGYVKNQNYYPYPTGTTAQYVRGDGSLATFTQTGGGGSSVSYYLNGGTSQGTIGGNTYYEMSKIAVIGTAADFNLNADGYIAQFVTDAGDPALLSIPGGNWNFEMYFSASSSGGTPSFYVELYKYDGTTLTLISSGSTNSELITSGTATDLYLTSLAVPTTTLTLTDRLAIRVYVNHSGRTITLHTQDGHLCQVITSFTTGLTALNGLTAQVQNFAVGTSGTDFNISSVIDTHTFNLPTASATKRGALSSADWTTFNNKQNALTNPITGTGTTNYLPKFTGASALGNSIISESGSAISIAGNLGVSATISSWISQYKAIDIGLGGFLYSRSDNDETSVGTNWYRDGSAAFLYKNNGFASMYTQGSGQHTWYNAPSGTAGNAVTFTQAMTLDASGQLGIGTSSPAYKLDVNGTARVTALFVPQTISTTSNAESSGSLRFNYATNANSRTWRLANDIDAYGDFAIQQSTTQTGSTFENKLIFSPSGAATFSSSVTAGSFIKSGGTSSQFLKADGSVDSSAYITSAALAAYLPLAGGTLTGNLNGTTSLFSTSVATTSHGTSAKWITSQTANGNFIPYSFESDYGNHSWGIIARFRINQAGVDRPSIQFSNASTDNRWNVGYCFNDDQFRITQNMGYRNDNTTTDSWGTERFRIDTFGTLYANGNVILDAGNYNTYAAALYHTHDLGRYSLAAPANIDALTTTNFRNTLFGNTSNTWNISTARWNTTPTALPGMNSYGTMLAWSGSDTQGFIATDYSTANITVGGGNGSNINWTALLITSANIGGQSVAFATTAGALTSMDISQFTNDSGYVTSSVLGDYLPLTGGALTGNLTTNSSIGIGTASPATALDVVGGAYSNTTAKFGNTKPIYIINDDPHIGFNTYYNSGWFYGAGSSSNFAGALGCAQTTGDFTLQTSTAAGNAGNAVTFVALMTWKQNGFVGIGTNVPSQRLEVNGNIKLSGAGGATATPSYIWLGNDYSNGVTRNKLKIYLYNSGTEQYGFTVGSIGDVQYHSNSYHDFYIANTLSLRINSSGDVGIGTASPQGKLSVDGGNINFNYGNVAANYYVYLNHNNSNDGGIIWQRNNSNDWQMVNAASSGDFWMYSYSTATVSVAIKRVTGYVGIGTLSPEFLLDVAGGNARINGVMVGKGSNSVSTNLAVGVQALYSNTSGSENTAVGYLAMYSTTTAIRNTALGNNALYSNTTGASNVAVGVGSLYSNIVGRYNSSVGYNSMQFMRGEYNSALGRDSMRGSLTAANNTGEYNTAVGYESMLVLTSGNWNTAVGNQAGANLSTGSYNTFIGRSTVAAAGGLVTTGSNNTIIGGYAGTTTLANTVVLADGAGQVQLWATGKNVALGTTSPTTYANYTTLHIAGQTTTNGGVLRLTTSDSSIAVNIFTNNAGANYDTTTSHSHLFNINGASSLIVSSSGIETAGSITTADPGLGAAAWQLGDVQNATISLITNRYVEVVIGGSSYQLALVQLE